MMMEKKLLTIHKVFTGNRNVQCVFKRAVTERVRNQQLQYLVFMV